MLSKDDEPVPWSTELFDCFTNFPNCCITLWCPCIPFGQVAEITDQGTTSCLVSGLVYTLLFPIRFSFIYGCIYRERLRAQFNLAPTPCSDWLVHCFCQPCALCQEYRELEKRGFQMSLGWKGNMEKQQQAQSGAPIIDNGMSR